MQICHRSPLTGYFEPAVQLGEHISAGAPLGTVSDLLGEKQEVVPAEQTGLVLVLKTFPRVEQEDALAVILETELDQQPGPG
jgi:hypothetical protein